MAVYLHGFSVYWARESDVKQVKRLTREDCLAMRKSCLSASLRKTERLVTRHYDRYLADTGITAVQLPILAAVEAIEEPTFRILSDDLELDRSTLSRNLALLQRNGLITLGEPAGPRAGTIALTGEGRRTLVNAHRLWRKAHRVLERTLTEASVAQGLRFLRGLRRAMKR